MSEDQNTNGLVARLEAETGLSITEETRDRINQIVLLAPLTEKETLQEVLIENALLRAKCNDLSYHFIAFGLNQDRRNFRRHG
jgi:hypothetical protein